MDQPPELNADLLAELKRLNANIERDIQSRVSWKIALRNGLFAALGGVLGTTVVLSVLVRVLKPLEQLSALRPVLERLADKEPGAKR